MLIIGKSLISTASIDNTPESIALPVILVFNPSKSSVEIVTLHKISLVRRSRYIIKEEWVIVMIKVISTC